MRRPAVLMTDPKHFAIRGGANPHTREADGALKTVDGERARRQWHGYVDALLDGGVDVYVIEAEPELTGMVFAANAGFVPGRLRDAAVSKKQFYPSHFTAEHRKGESELFRRFMRGFGFDVGDYDETLRFEGEADAFPVRTAGEPDWIFTHGFRSDPDVAEWLEGLLGTEPDRFELADPKFYHGDCILCELGGPLLVYTEGLTDESIERLRARFEGRLVEVDETDGENFVGNSFYVEVDGDRLLYTTDEMSEALRRRIEGLGIRVVPVDVSEFFGKGGGGPKCLVFNLGPVDRDAPDELPAVRDFRRRRHVEHLRDQNHFSDDR